MKTATAAAGGGAHRWQPHRPGRRARTDRRHRVVVDRLPRLQSSPYPGGGRPPGRPHAACHVRRAGARAGADAGAPARRAAARRSRPRVLLRVRLGLGRGRHEDGGAVLAQPGSPRPHPLRRLPRRLSRRHHRRDGGLRSGRRHAPAVPGLLPEQVMRRSAARRARPRRRSAHARAPCRDARRHHRRAAGAGRGRHAVSRCRDAAAAARARRPLRSAADLRRDLHRLRPHRHDVRLRGGGRRARHRHAVEGADRRHAAARRHGRAHATCSTRSGRTIRARR